MIEQATFKHSPLGKAFEKETKTTEGQDKKQIKAIDDYGKRLVESNELVNNDFNIDRDILALEKQRERSSGFRHLQKKKNDPDHMVSMYKTEGKSPKDFRNYQNLIELFKDLKDGNINPKELLKDQINLKSELGEIKKENKK